MTSSSVRAAPGLLSSAPPSCQPPFLMARPTHLELSPRTRALDAVGRGESGVAVQSPWVSTEQELGVRADLEDVLLGAMLATLLPPTPRAVLEKQGWVTPARALEASCKVRGG